MNSTNEYYKKTIAAKKVDKAIKNSCELREMVWVSSYLSIHMWIEWARELVSRRIHVGLKNTRKPVS